MQWIKKTGTSHRFCFAVAVLVDSDDRGVFGHAIALYCCNSELIEAFNRLRVDSGSTADNQTEITAKLLQNLLKELSAHIDAKFHKQL